MDEWIDSNRPIRGDGWMDGWREAEALTSSSSSMSSSADMTSVICWTAATSSVRARRAATSRRFSSEYSTHSLDSVSCAPRLSQNQRSPKDPKRTEHNRTFTRILAPAPSRTHMHEHPRACTHACATHAQVQACYVNDTVKRAAKRPTHFSQAPLARQASKPARPGARCGASARRCRSTSPRAGARSARACA